MLTPPHNLGAQGEDLAAHWLQQQGYRIVARNWRAKQLELDIIARHGGTLVFVEVKTRSCGGLGSPVEAVGYKKQASLVRAARAYLAAHDLWQAPSRFDVITIVRLSCTTTKTGFATMATPPAKGGAHILPWQGATFSVEHYPHAFELPSALDCGNTAWQPW